jgi:hypothetical protein
VRDTAEEWLRRWHAHPISLQASSDASDFGYGGLVKLPDGRSVPVLGNLSKAKILMSSAARKATGFLRLLEATRQMFPKTIKNSTVLLVSDSQAAVAALNSFRSKTTEENDILKRIFNLCVTSGATVMAVWQPRDLLDVEDLLSRQPDSSG